MIGFLSGKIISKKPTEILLNVNGVGYIVHISVNTFEALSDDSESVSLYTYMAVREDSVDLYGFASMPEKEMFILLIGITGIGPKLAQSILSGIQTEELSDAIRHGNISRLLVVPGIGRKTAERILIELKDKVDQISAESGRSESFGIKHDAVSALIGLGYNQKTAGKAVKKALETDASLTIEEVIKEALRLLNSQSV